MTDPVSEQLAPADRLVRLWYRVLRRLLVRVKYNPGPIRVLSARDTIDFLVENKASMGRFGDGEFALMFGGDIHFQRYDVALSRRLRQVVGVVDRGFMVAIPDFDNLRIRRNVEKKARMWAETRSAASYFLEPHRTYFTANIARPFATGERFDEDYIRRIKAIWDGRDGVLVTSDPAIAGHPMFANSASLRAVRCLPRHAFDDYDHLLESTVAMLEPGMIALLSAGPTATVLAYDIYRSGYQSVDVGQLTGVYDLVTGAVAA